MRFKDYLTEELKKKIEIDDMTKTRLTIKDFLIPPDLYRVYEKSLDFKELMKENKKDLIRQASFCVYSQNDKRGRLVSYERMLFRMPKDELAVIIIDYRSSQPKIKIKGVD